jgi:hypothetical protein
VEILPDGLDFCVAPIINYLPALMTFHIAGQIADLPHTGSLLLQIRPLVENERDSPLRVEALL